MNPTARLIELDAEIARAYRFAALADSGTARRKYHPRIRRLQAERAAIARAVDTAFYGAHARTSIAPVSYPRSTYAECTFPAKY